MIFALATDEGTLFVFPSSVEAVAHCEGIDVEDGIWRFWEERGSPLAAHFLTPNFRAGSIVGNGTYQLVPVSVPDHLATALDGARLIQANSFFGSIAAVRAYLAGLDEARSHGA